MRQSPKTQNPTDLRAHRLGRIHFVGEQNFRIPPSFSLKIVGLGTEETSKTPSPLRIRVSSVFRQTPKGIPHSHLVHFSRLATVD